MRHSGHMLAGVAGFILLGGCYVERAVAQSAPETTGPYTVVMEMDPSLPEHTVYRPEQVNRVKGKLPEHFQLVFRDVVGEPDWACRAVGPGHGPSQFFPRLVDAVREERSEREILPGARRR